MTTAEIIFSRMEFDRPYSVEELSEMVSVGKPQLYAALRQLYAGQVIEREKIGRKYQFKSKQASVL